MASTLAFVVQNDPILIGYISVEGCTGSFLEEVCDLLDVADSDSEPWSVWSWVLCVG